MRAVWAQDSLGGNAKTVIIAAVSNTTEHAAETLSTLRFAQRAKFIRNQVSPAVYLPAAVSHASIHQASCLVISAAMFDAVADNIVPSHSEALVFLATLTEERS